MFTKEERSGEESLNEGFSGQASILLHCFGHSFTDEFLVVIAQYKRGHN